MSPPATKQPETPAVSDIGRTAELVSKLAATLILVVYGAGFLITTLHASSYGFIPINPLRPRIASAGMWFLIFVGVPILSVYSLKNQINEIIDKRDWKRLGESIIGYYSFTWLLLFVSLHFFEFPTTSSAPVHMTLRSWVQLALLVFVCVLVLLLMNWTKNKGWQKTWCILALLAPTYSCVMAVYHALNGRPDYTLIPTWFFVIGVFATAELCNKSNLQHWAQTIFFALSLLGIFAWDYYPHIKASWGGGGAISIVLYLSKDAPIAPGKQIQALMLDETDSGFYIVPKQENRAIFLPRGAVTLVYFSDKIADSPLLRNGTQ